MLFHKITIFHESSSRSFQHFIATMSFKLQKAKKDQR